MNMKLVLAFSNRLFSASIKKLFEEDPSVTVEALRTHKSPEEAHGEARSAGADIVLVDFPTLAWAFSSPDATDDLNLLLVDTGLSGTNKADAVVRLGVKGVLGVDTTPEMLKNAALAVASGELWLDRAGMKDVLEEIQHLNRTKDKSLSGREVEVAYLAGRGMRNKEIADKLFISEPTVKAHLKNIYRKLDIHSRSQLVSYTHRRPESSKHGSYFAPMQ